MGTFIAGLDTLTLHEPIFKDVKYYLSGEVPEKITELLRAGGGEQAKYFSDFVSHLICGLNAPETDLSDASDLYEIPAATYHWVVACVRQKKVVSPKPYSPARGQLFSGVVACLAQVGARDVKGLFALLTYYGGAAKLSLDPACTHLVCGSVTGSKYAMALTVPQDKLRVVTPDWVTDSIRAKAQCSPDAYHPRLLKPPPPAPPPPDSRISSITGFDFEEGIAKSEVPTQNMTDCKDLESTQALLDKLKQRMPWNHPAPPISAAPVVNAGGSVIPGNAVPKMSVHPGLMAPGLIGSGLMPSGLPKGLSIPPGTPVSQPYGQTVQQVLQFQNSQSSVGQTQVSNPAPGSQHVNQPQGLSAIQIQQQRMLQQHQLRHQMQLQQQQQQQQQNLQQQQQNQNMQQSKVHLQQSLGIGQPNHGVSQQSQGLPMSHPQGQNINPAGVGQLMTLHQQLTSAGTQQGLMSQKQVHGALVSQQLPQQGVAGLPVQSPIQQQGQHLGPVPTGQNHNLIQMNQHQGQPHTLSQQSNQNHGQQQGQAVGVGQQPHVSSQQQMGMNQSQGQAVNQQSLPISSQGNGIVGQQQTQLHSLGQQIHGQQNLPIQGQSAPMQQPWRQQQGVQLVQNSQLGSTQGQQVRSTMLQQRTHLQQNQMILQHQIIQNQNLLGGQQQLSGQHGLIQQPAQQLGQTGPPTGQQVLVQKQLQQPGQQQIMINQQQIGTGPQHQQILVQGNQHISLQSAPQLGQQGGAQLLTPGTQQLLAPGQPLLQGQQLLQGQAGLQGQPMLQGTPQAGQAPAQPPGQMIAWQQQQQFMQQRQQQIITGQPGAVQRVSWGAGTGGRQLIHLDAQTHAQLQQMDPQQRALFVAQLQKRRQLTVQRAAASAQAPGVTFVRGQPQQQVQWVAQGARAATQGAPAEPPGQQQQQRQQYAQLQLQQQQRYRQLQHLQAQREQAQKQAQAQGQVAGVAGVGNVGGVTGLVGTSVAVPVAPVPGRALPEVPDLGVPTGVSPDQEVGVLGAGAPPLVVNPRTRTALANMLSIRLQGAQPAPIPDAPEPSAAGTLRLMTAAHNAPPRAPAEVQSLQQRRAAPTLHHQLPVSPHQAPLAYCAPGTRAVAPPAPPRAQFYGHNPNLKLPPDLFLLGCIFHVVEYDDAEGWAEAVGRHGGELEPGYCARVTHVLAQTQRHGVVMQALRDAKRCVSAYWLSDTMARRQVVPPWQALHLPLMYGAHDSPAQRHRASLTGFSGEERSRLRFMLRHAGAKVTAYMSRDNSVLICRRAEGMKYQRAKEWGIPTVTAQWVTDLLLGNMSALSQIENSKYQQYNVPNPFKMDYTLVPHLMNAWKMPINITQESHERVKRGALGGGGGGPRKKLRPNPMPALSITCLQPPPPALAPRVMFSFIKDVEPYSNIVRQLGGFVVTAAVEATHLVMGKLARTPKLVACLVTARFLLSINWLMESQKICKFAEEAKFPLRDPEFEEIHKCDLAQVLAAGPQRRKLLEGITFYMTPSVQPGRAAMTEIIELCGGKVDKNRKSFVSIQEIHRERPNSYLVLTVPNDLHLVYYLLQAEKSLNIVCNSEMVIAAVMQQKLDVPEFLVKID